jgi:hypothetical protein
LSIGLVAYTIWANIRASEAAIETWPYAVLAGAAAMLSEGAGWLTVGFVFGYLYSRLADQTGLSTLVYETGMPQRVTYTPDTITPTIAGQGSPDG